MWSQSGGEEMSVWVMCLGVCGRCGECGMNIFRASGENKDLCVQSYMCWSGGQHAGQKGRSRVEVHVTVGGVGTGTLLDLAGAVCQIGPRKRQCA